MNLRLMPVSDIKYRKFFDYCITINKYMLSPSLNNIANKNIIDANI